MTTGAQTDAPIEEIEGALLSQIEVIDASNRELAATDAAAAA
jgi:hypothetical protein